MSLHVILARLRMWFGRPAVERDMDDEMRFHLEMETAKHMRSGLPEGAARRAALVSFGGVDRHQEAMRDGRGTRFFEDFVRDGRYAVRVLVRNPGYTLAIVFTLALAIGTNASVFSTVNGIMLRPFDVAQPERLVALWNRDEGGATEIGYDDYVDWRDKSGLFESLAAQFTAPISVTNGGSTDIYWTEVVTGNYFSTLGLKPLLGRFFLPGEETRRGGATFMVLSYDLWRGRFNSDSSIVGRVVRVNRAPVEIIGVAPRGFYGIRRFGFWPDAWLPLGAAGTERYLSGRGAGALLVVGRLKAGLDRGSAEPRGTAFARNLEQTYNATNRDLGALLTSARTPFDSPRFVPPRILWLASILGLFGVGLILLIACANVANLMLARAAARRREMAVRLSIGGSRGRLIRQLLTESALLSLMGGLMGLPLTLIYARWQLGMLPQLQFKVGVPIELDHRVILFTLAVTFLSVFLFGLAPALAATRLDLVPALRNEGARARHSRRPELRNVLVGAQLALSVMLLIAGGLFTRSLRASQRVDLGLATADRIVISANPEVHGYDDARALSFYAEARRRVEQLPGVRSAAWAFPVPFDSYGSGIDLFIAGATEARKNQTTALPVSAVDPGYFATLGTPLLEGREFALGDSTGAPGVLIVNRATAERFFSGQEPIGQRVRVGSAAGRELTVVGVVDDAVYTTASQQHQPYVFVPVRQRNTKGLSLIVHTATGEEAMIGKVRAALRSVDPEVASYGAITMKQSARNPLNGAESAANLAGVMAIIALSIAVIGLYGVVAYTVERRQREIGIRIALGARPSSVIRLFLVQTARTTAIGVGIGLVGALALAKAIATLLYGVSPFDALTFIAVPFALVIVALAAAYVPARRAVRVEPTLALRSE